MSYDACGCVCHDLGDDRETCAARGCCAAWRKGHAQGLKDAAKLVGAIRVELGAGVDAAYFAAKIRALAAKRGGEKK